MTPEIGREYGSDNTSDVLNGAWVSVGKERVYLPHYDVTHIGEFVRRFDESIIYKDEHVLAINKPAKIPMTQGENHPFGLADIVHTLVDRETSPAHRLDIDTSGVVLFGRTKKARRKFGKQIENKEVRKNYLAIVDGNWESKVAGIVAPVSAYGENPKLAATGITSVTKSDEHSLLRVTLHTGRTHQIRLHLSQMNHPIVGDRMYNEDPTGADRQLLHAEEYSFRHPVTHELTTVKAPLPKDFEKFLEVNNL